MKVIKRNGSEVTFDITKIIAAITKANESVDESIRMTPMQIQRIAESVEFSCLKMNRSPSVEEIQDLVEYQIMAHGAYEIAKNYVTYRYTRSLVRRSNTTDEKILSLIECCNEEAKQENANKNPVVNSTQRDYMAGEVSRDITERILLPQEIVEAHREGIIHFHDADYYAQHMHNCDLVNLEDMLQNGTVITGTLIERPHSFATPFALSIMQKMNDKCAEWKKAENIDYSLYGTPLESTTYKFAKCLQRRFGIIPGITDKGYITNSYHVHVTEEINAFDKLKFEAQFQHLSPGGAISYVEVPDMQNNIPAVLEVMKFIYDNIIYAELNTKSDYCQVCGWDGEIQIAEEHGKLIWKCPKCGNTDQDKMNVARRTCGYIGTQFWNQGRTQEIRDRVLHL